MEVAVHPHRRMSPLGLQVEIEDHEAALYKHEFRELLRGFAGALFVALPLLYTQEMWERARNIDERVLLLILGGSFVISLGYISYSGFKSGRARVHLQWDAMVAIGLGLLASFITLCITARITTAVACLLALMSVPTGFGAALAINQLGKRGTAIDATESIAVKHLSEDMEKVTATTLGGVLFAFNIVPTIEPKVMLAEIGPKHGLAIVAFSLLISYGIEYTARFQADKNQRKGVLGEKWLSTLFCYLVSLIVAAILLWAFGYLHLGTPPGMAMLWVIIVGYATTLGGTAGRLIL
jgi:putative integral membrane protein (TIGR02587 family)